MMRRGIAVAGIFGLGLTLAACGSSDASDNSSDKPSGNTSTLVVWADDTRSPVITDVAKQFTKDTGVKVNVVQKAYEKLRDDFTTQVPTGKGPDIVIGGGDWTGKFVQNGVVAPVELGDTADGFAKVAVDGVTYDGKVYGLPYAIENLALIRNTALAPKAPATMQDAVSTGKALVSEGKAKYPFLIQMDPTSGDPYHMYPVQMSFGAAVFGENPDGTYNPDELVMDSDAGRSFAKFVSTLGSQGVVSPSITADIAKEAFLNGQAPYMITGPWNTTDFTKKGLNISVEKIPSAGSEEARPFVGIQAFFISAKSKNPVAANQFAVQYLGSKDAQLALYKAGGRPPALTAAAEDPSVTSDPILAGFNAVGQNGVPSPNIPAMDAVWQDWGTTEVALAKNQGDPVELWNKMCASIKQKIAEAKNA